MKKTLPRIVPSRDAKYMGLAWLIASFSKDPATQIGAIIVDPETNRPLGTGYNGPPAVFDDQDVPWNRPDKYNWIDHAEVNAIDHSSGSLVGADLYVTAMPCVACMRRIAKKKIGRVIYCDFRSDSGSSLNKDDEIVQDMVKKSKIKLEKFEGNLAWMSDWMFTLNNLGVFSKID